MDLFGRKRRADDAPRETPDPARDRGSDRSRDGAWPHSKQYSAILSEGHLRPAPAFGSPTLIWHLGVWQREIPGERARREYEAAGKPGFNASQMDEYIGERLDAFNDDNSRFFREVSEFIQHVQRLGRRKDVSTEAPFVEELSFVLPDELPGDDLGFEMAVLSKDQHFKPRFGVCDPQSLNFTLWWRDDAGPQPDGSTRLNKPALTPSRDDLRVQTQVQAHHDHVTITFYIDISKPFNSKPIYETKDAYGVRRTKIAAYLDVIRDVAEKQIKGGLVELERLPEEGVSPDEAEQLRDAADFLYSDIWREFAASFGLKAQPLDDGGLAGELFADFRGLLLGVDGFPPASQKKRCGSVDIRGEAGGPPAPRNPREAQANPGFGLFDRFDTERGEPNTTIKSLWPFIRRATPWADYCDYIANGIIDWRALYVTALGASRRVRTEDEFLSRARELPAGFWPRAEDQAEDKDAPPPFLRYLVVSKGQPHREQIGRFVERINSIGTMRLLSLKNIATIKNASVYLRLLGRELDRVLQEWRLERRRIERETELRQRARAGGWGMRLFRTRASVSRDDAAWRAEELSNLIAATQKKLILLASEIDRPGNGGAGRFLYVLSRSRYYASEFGRMHESLETSSIDGWINYAQFVQRGLKPTFDLFDGTGERLVAFSERLQSITNMIHTSALVVEAEETRRNTFQLEKIARSLRYAPAFFALALVLLEATIEELGLIAWVKALVERLIGGG